MIYFFGFENLKIVIYKKYYGTIECTGSLSVKNLNKKNKNIKASRSMIVNKKV